MNDGIQEDLKAARETCWINEQMYPFSEEKERLLLKREDIEDASKRLARFAPLIAKLFPGNGERPWDDRIAASGDCSGKGGAWKKVR